VDRRSADATRRGAASSSSSRQVSAEVQPAGWRVVDGGGVGGVSDGASGRSSGWTVQQ